MGFVKLASLVGGRAKGRKTGSGFESRKYVGNNAKEAVEPGSPSPTLNPEVWLDSDAKGACTPPSSANQDEVRRKFCRI